jgi:hypothetical protein
MLYVRLCLRDDFICLGLFRVREESRFSQYSKTFRRNYEMQIFPASFNSLNRAFTPNLRGNLAFRLW